MNTGMQDAANLGWKLAAVVHGWAPEGLLDSYQAERYPVGRAVLRGSGALLRVALAQSWTARLARGVVKNVVGRLGLVPSRAARAVSGIGIAYPSPPDGHPLAGRRAPDIPLAGDGSSRLYETLRAGRFVLVRRDDAPVPAGWDERVASGTTDAMPAHAVLVRPDGYVAWATDEQTPQALDIAVREALGSWCGTPAKAV
jgi:hypothetical protein